MSVKIYQSTRIIVADWDQLHSRTSKSHILHVKSKRNRVEGTCMALPIQFIHHKEPVFPARNSILTTSVI